MILVTGIFVFIGIVLYTVFHSMRKAILDGAIAPINYPILWVIVIIGFIALFIHCSCS